MNIALKLALFGALALSATAAAADKNDPTGTWKLKFKLSDTVVEQKLVMEHKDGKVTGTLAGGGKGGIDKIEDGTFKDGTLKFTVTRGTDNLKVVVKHEGKVEGDTIKGVVTFDFMGTVTKNDFEATREKK
jgi:hypothetical protein